MIDRRLLIAGIATMPILSLRARAASSMSFDPKAFQEAQAKGKTILIDISAPWCPVCKAQAPILETLWTQPEFKDYAVFNVDFDSQKNAVRSFRATSQSTLIVFKGNAEVGRSVGDTDQKSIAALLKKGV